MNFHYTTSLILSSVLLLNFGCIQSGDNKNNSEIKLKVMQCWDDSPNTDTTLIRLLKKYSAKATFNIIPLKERIPIFMKKKRKGDSVLFSFYPKDQPKDGTVEFFHMALNEQPEVYKGFKVAGHRRIPLGDSPGEHAERMTSLLGMKNQIKTMFGQDQAGYCYPGGHVSDPAARDIENADFLYARTTKNEETPLSLDDPYHLSTNCHWAAKDFWKKYENAKEKGGVFYFWGHSVEMGNDPKLWDWYESIVKRISEDPEAEWVDVVDVFSSKIK